MKLRAAGIVLLGLVTTPVAADNIDINLRDEAIRASYSMDLENGLRTGFGFLYSEDEEQLDDTLYHAGLLVSGENWSETGTFDVSLGGRFIYSAPGEADLGAIAFGGELRFSPVHRLGIGGSLYYSPSVTSFMDADNYSEFGLRLDYQLLPQAFIYGGYRNIEVDIADGQDGVELDEGFHAGFKLLF